MGKLRSCSFSHIGPSPNLRVIPEVNRVATLAKAETLRNKCDCHHNNRAFVLCEELRFRVLGLFRVIKKGLLIPGKGRDKPRGTTLFAVKQPLHWSIIEPSFITEASGVPYSIQERNSRVKVRFQ